MNKEQRTDLIRVHGAVALFGLVGLFAETLPLPAAVIVWGRVFFSALFLLVWQLVRRKPPVLARKSHLAVLAGAGALLAAHWTSFMLAIQLSTVATGTLSFSTFPLFAAVLEPLFFREKPRKEALAASLVMLAGLGVMLAGPGEGVGQAAGIAWGLVSAFTYALLSLLHRRYSPLYPAATLAMYEQGWATVWLLPALLAWGGSFTPGQLAALAGLGVVFTGIAHSLFIAGLRTVRVQTAGVISGLEPVYGILAAFVVLGQRPSLREWLGGGMILAAALGCTLASGKKQ